MLRRFLHEISAFSIVHPVWQFDDGHGSGSVLYTIQSVFCPLSDRTNHQLGGRRFICICYQQTVCVCKPGTGDGHGGRNGKVYIRRLFSFGVQTVCLAVLVEFAHWNENVVRLPVLVIVTILNYIVSRVFVFDKARSQQKSEEEAA